MWGFGICFATGWVIAFAGCFALPSIGTHPERFALLYTLGNIIALASTMFLWGPCSQLKKMFAPERLVATVVYLGSMALTLFLAFYVQKVLPVILSLILQCLAMVWYAASYIPFGQQMIKSCLCGLCGVK